ncbi:acyl-CoA dehydrogenase [Sphingomonas metalli]|uniref:Acyl-CoA dehydrogenase n=1 Tax=Sphingomonas metalli TaxID=1779358 RepID=A0A916WYU1_9SPHN|nr:acyl-CoA dehydrogenase [Sphingomonas metalli]GGB40133.1 acyl-CoA dehydrogenase [Sphingomonas metalli]
MIDLRRAIAARSTLLPGLGDPVDRDALLQLLRLLFETGRADLPLGRLFEGHVDAVQIVLRYGTAAQRERVAAAVADGAAFGVWNADLAGEPLGLTGMRLTGGKSFASGAGLLSHALIGIDGVGGRQLLLLDLARTPPSIDRAFWRVTGMQRSETHVVRWRDAPVAEDDLIGAPGDYVREPWFSGGALRFAAVQAGGIAALLDHSAAHLVAAGRAGDPHQAGRLAALYGLAEAAAGAIRTAAAGWFGDEAARLPLVAAARAAVYAAGGPAIELAEQAVGVQSLFAAHPLAATIADLSMYLRQPAPDAQRMHVGAAVASGLLTAGL